jgi:hypothetical protein
MEKSPLLDVISCSRAAPGVPGRSPDAGSCAGRPLPCLDGFDQAARCIQTSCNRRRVSNLIALARHDPPLSFKRRQRSIGGRQRACEQCQPGSGWILAL